MLREGMLRPHFVKIFRWIDNVLSGRPSDIYVTRPMEAILVTMWQGIFRPDECVWERLRTRPFRVWTRWCFGTLTALRWLTRHPTRISTTVSLTQMVARMIRVGRTLRLFWRQITRWPRGVSRRVFSHIFAIQSGISASGQVIGHSVVPDEGKGPHFQSVWL